MLKHKKKGFTLVELLVTIVLLGVIGAIVIYNMTSISTSSKEVEYERYIAKVKSAASVYADMNQAAFNELYVSRAYIYIKIDDLVKNGLLDADLVNPYTNERIDLSDLVKASLDTTNGSVVFEYPMNETLTESTLVAISDYVVWGEPYDCMRGAGSYELALSDEEGNLIDLTATDEHGVKNMQKYNFACQMPKEFENYNDPSTGVKGLRTTKPGNYEITYSWITESGTKKTASRILRVLSKSEPSFKTNVADYDFGKNIDVKNGANNFIRCSNCDANNFYQPSLNSDGSWRVLTYEPLIEGSDAANSSFKISKKRNNPSSNVWEDVSGGYVTSFAARQADDGDKTYKIEATVHGHYIKNYTYNSEGYARFKQELILPSQYISSDTPSTNWGTKNSYNINSDTTGHQSPVGIARYEYRISNSTSMDKSLEVINANLFEKIATVTSKDVSILSDTSCVDRALEYTNIFFRAINKDGYVGTWTRYDTKLTNQLTKLIDQDSNSCSSSASCCLRYGSECYYTNKVLYVSANNQLLVGLRKYGDGSMLFALDGTTNVKVSPLSLMNGYAEQQTCDGTFYKNYTYNVANDNIQREVLRWANASFGGSSKVVTPVIPGGASYSATTLDKKLLMTYGSAVAGNPTHWLLDNGRSETIIYLDQPHKHANESTTAYNAYFYYAQGLNAHQQYSGQMDYVKPLIRLRDLNICSGSGTASDPFIVLT